MTTVDLNNLPANTTLSIAREETAGERRVRLFKDVTLFIAAIAFVGIIVGIVKAARPLFQFPLACPRPNAAKRAR